MFSCVGVVITTHGDTGNVTINNIENVVKYIPQSHIFVFNNESKCKIISNIPNKYPFINYTYIDNQIKNHGLTGTWNMGVQKCLDIGCTVVVILNNDVLINETIYSVLNHAISSYDKPFYYGVISDFPGHSSKYQKFRPINQYLVSKNKNPISKEQWKKYTENDKDEIIQKLVKSNLIKQNQNIKINYGNGLTELTKSDIYINGFSLILTKKILELNKIGNSEYFNNKFPFSGNDNEWFHRCLKNNSKAFIDTNTWIKHYKYNSWKRLNK